MASILFGRWCEVACGSWFLLDVPSKTRLEVIALFRRVLLRWKAVGVRVLSLGVWRGDCVCKGLWGELEGSGMGPEVISCIVGVLTLKSSVG
jgi:hypothetical protein